MSDESTSSSPEPAVEAASAPKVRRISNKNPKKATKVANEKKAAEEAVPMEEFDSTPPAGDEVGGESSDPQGEPKRKNRRRRGKGKSAQNDGETSSDDAAVFEDVINLGEPDSNESGQASSDSNQQTQPTRDSNHRQEHQGGGRRDQQHQQHQQHQQNQRPPQKQRSRLDPDKLAKSAWKIFLAEVSEEGVALIGDNDARELTRRCFRLAEIFLEEESRRN